MPSIAGHEGPLVEIGARRIRRHPFRFGRKNPTAAERFELRVRQIAQRIERFPEGFQEVAERPGIRRVPLVRYPYLIFYTRSGGEVTVLRIVHGARKEPWENL